MDIKGLYTSEEHSDGAEMQIMDKIGDSVDLFITMIGCDSKEWRKITSKLSRDLLMLSDEDDGSGRIDAEAEALACAAIGWRKFTDKDKEYKFSKARVKALYINAPYIREQADRFIAKRVNFIKSKAS